MSDIVERLRERDQMIGGRPGLYTDAADHIENLEAAIKAGGKVGNKALTDLQAALAELASLRARLAEVEGERDKWRAAIRAADQLSIAAQTSGGVAGHDDGLVSAISHYAQARAALEDQS